MKKVFFACVLFTNFLVQAQQIIKGIVLDKKTSLPIEGVSITNGFGGTVSGINGEFSFKLKNAYGGTLLKFSASGYEDIDSLLANSNKEILIYLKSVSFLLQPVEVNALRAPEKAPFAIKNISKAYIEKNNAGQDLPFLLNQTPSVVINSDAGTGIGYTGIRIRGTDATRINVTINGIPYNDAESQGTYFVDLPDVVSSVSSIQVQRGVGTSSNGAGAFGASINLSTNEYNDKTYIELNNSYGSFNSWKNTIKFGSGLIAKHFTFDGRLSSITSDGYIDRAGSSLRSGYISTGYWSKKTSIRFNAILGKEKTYQAWYGVPESMLKTNRTYNMAGTDRPGEPYDKQTDNYWQNHYQLFWNQQLNNKWSSNLTLFYTKGYGYYEEYKGDASLSNYGLQPIIDGNNTIFKTDLIRRLWLNNDFFGQTFSLQHKGEKQQLTIGGGWSRYLGNHYGEVIWSKAQPSLFAEYYRHNADKSDANLYIKHQTYINKFLQLYADAQYRYVGFHINGFKDNPTIIIDAQYHFINPKVGLTYTNKDWSGFLSYAMANKEPNRDDFEAGKTQQPQREQLHDLELNIKKRNILKNFDVASTFYLMYYKDQLILTGKINDVGAYTRTNIPNSYRVGAELEASYASRIWNAYYSISLSRNKIVDFTEYVDDYDNGGQKEINHGKTDISFSPSIIQNITLNILPIKNFEISWMGKHVGKQFLDNTSSPDRMLNGFVINDLRVAYILKNKIIKEIKFAVRVNNLFNVKYEPNGYTFSYINNGKYTYENYYYPMAGTNWLASLNIRF